MVFGLLLNNAYHPMGSSGLWSAGDKHWRLDASMHVGRHHFLTSHSSPLDQAKQARTPQKKVLSTYYQMLQAEWLTSHRTKRRSRSPFTDGGEPNQVADPMTQIRAILQVVRTSPPFHSSYPADGNFRSYWIIRNKGREVIETLPFIQHELDVLSVRGKINSILGLVWI